LGLSEIFALKLALLFGATGWSVDLVTVVPLSRGRIKERGFNQADLIARTLALAIRKPYRPAALKRVRETRSQVGLSAIERRQNVQDAFSADEKIVAGRNVLIIDDVTTTGATMSACSRACLEKTAYNVYGLTIARAVITAHT
jgi:ComF family protein